MAKMALFEFFLEPTPVQTQQTRRRVIFTIGASIHSFVAAVYKEVLITLWSLVDTVLSFFISGTAFLLQETYILVLIVSYLPRLLCVLIK
jgi:hypothetical protein